TVRRPTLRLTAEALPAGRLRSTRGLHPRGDGITARRLLLAASECLLVGLEVPRLQEVPGRGLARGEQLVRLLGRQVELRRLHPEVRDGDGPDERVALQVQLVV